MGGSRMGTRRTRRTTRTTRTTRTRRCRPAAPARGPQPNPDPRRPRRRPKRRNEQPPGQCPLATVGSWTVNGITAVAARAAGPTLLLDGLPLLHDDQTDDVARR